MEWNRASCTWFSEKKPVYIQKADSLGVFFVKRKVTEEQELSEKEECWDQYGTWN